MTIRCFYLFAAVSAATVLAQTPTPNYTDGILAVVNDEMITVYDVAAQNVMVERKIISSYTPKQMADPEIRRQIQERISKSRYSVVVDIINEKLIYAEFESNGYKLPSNIIEKRIDEIVRNDHQGDWDAFGRRLEQTEMTMDEFREQIQRNIAVDYLLMQEVHKQARVSRQAMENYYNNHQANYTKASRVRLELISVPTAADAKDVLKKHDGGAKFADLAEQHSNHPSRQNRGNLGMMAVKDMAQPFRNAFNSLTVGAISNPFEFEGNIVILRVAQVKGAKVRSLEEVADDIERILKRKQRKLRKREYIQSLRAQNYVKIFFKTPIQPKKKG